MTKEQQKLLDKIGEGLVEVSVYGLTVAAVSRDSKRNNLAASKLAESFSYVILDDGGIQIIANSYWQAIEKGQPAGTVVPIAALVEWAKRYHIKPRRGSFNGMISAIQRAIIRRGTAPRPFVDDVLKNADKLVFANLDKLIEITFFSDKS